MDMTNPELHTTRSDRDAASRRVARLRSRIGVVLLGAVLPASTAAAAAGPSTVAADVPDAAVERLRSADRLVRLGLPEIAAEHLLAADPDRLPETHLLAYAGHLAYVVQGLDFVHRPLQQRLFRELDDPRLAPFAALWHARALVEIRRGRVSAALEAWNESLGREAEDGWKVVVFRHALAEVYRADPFALRYDAEVQDGALRAFIDTWTARWPLDPEVAETVLAVERKLDPEGPRASRWGDRLLELRQASPSALLQRGRLELARQRPDMALPWLLWAAYTDSLRSRQSPRSWAALSRVYLELGWCQHAFEAIDRSLSKSPYPSCEPQAELAGKTGACLSWHDDLLGYSPERLVIAWRGSWQRSVPDLARWRAACRWATPDPFANLPRSGDCSRRRKLPRHAADRLSRPRPHPVRLLCTITQTDLRSPALDRAFEDRLADDRLAELHPVSQADYLFAWALHSLRQGNVRPALSDFDRALARTHDPHTRVARLQYFARALAYVPGAAGETTLSWLEQRYRQLAEDGGPWFRARHAQSLAALFLRMAPSSPFALRWSERALIESPGSWRVWFYRASLEQHRFGPISALPYLIWAYQQMEVRELPAWEPDRGHYRELTVQLIGSYSHLRWWNLASELAATLDDEWPEPGPHGLTPLEPGDLPEPRVPSACRRLHSRLEQAGADAAARSAGERWRERIPVLAQWQEVCAQSERATPAREPIRESDPPAGTAKAAARPRCRSGQGVDATRRHRARASSRPSPIRRSGNARRARERCGVSVAAVRPPRSGSHGRVVPEWQEPPDRRPGDLPRHDT